MSIYPPPPPGWDSRLLISPNAPKQANLEDTLTQWAEARGYEYTPRPSAEWYQSWAPFVFLFKPSRIAREVRASFGDAQVWIVEAHSEDEEKRGEEGRYVLSFLLSPRLAGHVSGLELPAAGGMEGRLLWSPAS